MPVYDNREGVPDVLHDAVLVHDDVLPLLIPGDLPDVDVIFDVVTHLYFVRSAQHADPGRGIEAWNQGTMGPWPLETRTPNRILGETVWFVMHYFQFYTNIPRHVDWGIPVDIWESDRLGGWPFPPREPLE